MEWATQTSEHAYGMRGSKPLMARALDSKARGDMEYEYGFNRVVEGSVQEA